MNLAGASSSTIPDFVGELLPIPRSPALAGRLTVTVLATTMVAIGFVTAAANWHLTDLKAYLAAAELMAAGGNPFDVQLWERGLPYHYHYSPWFAALFVPLLTVSTALVGVVWSAVLIAASIAALVPVIRHAGTRAYPLVALMVFLLTNLVAEGNVQPLLLAGLVWSLEQRAGPFAIAVAASLKITPILLALVYVGRREWGRAGVAVAVSAVLVAPTLFYDLPETATATGGTGLFTTAPVVWALLAAGCAVVTLVLASSRLAWLAAATATVVALPRLLIFDVTNLLAAVPHRHQRRS